MQRVIVVIPYLSIIEQNAAEYRKALDPKDEGIVIEHHSAVAVKKMRSKPVPQKKLAAENWDAPVIVTTSVQFIESLFANGTSKCWKMPRYQWMSEFGRSVQSVRPILRRSADETVRALDTKAVEQAAADLRKYVAMKYGA